MLRNPHLRKKLPNTSTYSPWLHSLYLSHHSLHTNLPRFYWARQLHSASPLNWARPPNWTKQLHSKQVGFHRMQSTTFFRKQKIHVSETEKILADPTRLDAILEDLKTLQLTPDRERSIEGLFIYTLDMATGPMSDQAYHVLLEIWLVVFFRRNDTQNLRRRLETHRDRIVHLMINRFDYVSYKSFIQPLGRVGSAVDPTVRVSGSKVSESKVSGSKNPESADFGSKISGPANSGSKLYSPGSKTWTELIMETFKFSLDRHGIPSTSTLSVMTFLSSDRYTSEQKHLMIATYIQKSFSGPQNSPSPEWTTVVSNYVHYLSFMESLEFPSHHMFNIHRTALTAISVPRDGISIHLHVAKLHTLLKLNNIEPCSCAAFLSSILHSICTSNPRVALVYWEHLSGSELTEFRTPRDLLAVMKAHLSLKSSGQALQLYEANQELQDDSQIEILLDISVESKKWNLLQKQFEDMYGRDNLPLVVHYTVVMGALSTLGATEEIDRLYDQLLSRNLKPTAEIFHSIIRSRMNTGDYEGANTGFRTFMEYVRDGTICRLKVAGLQTLLLEQEVLQSNIDGAMYKFTDLVKAQSEYPQLPLIDSRCIAMMFDLMSSTYSLKYFDQVFHEAQKFHLLNEHTYHRAIALLTRMGRFLEADQLVFKAHHDSEFPYTSSLILSAELRNYRLWYRETTDKMTREIIPQRIYLLIQRIETGMKTTGDVADLYAEIIRHYITLKRPERAEEFLHKAQASGAVSEKHYLPLLRFRTTSDAYGDNSATLQLYRDMARRKIDLSAETYYYLLKSLIKIETITNNGFTNSFKLLQSVFDIYGFSMATPDPETTSKVSTSKLARDSVFLLRIVSEYAQNCFGESDDNLGLAVNFLAQLQHRLGKKFSRDFRVSVFVEMARLYQLNGNHDMADTLLNKAFADLENSAGVFQLEIPKMLQLEYRRVMDIKLQSLVLSEAHADAYEILLEKALAYDIRLSKFHFDQIHEKILRSDKLSTESLEKVFEACERYLVAGSLGEKHVNSAVYEIYRIFICYLSRRLSHSLITEKYAIFNKYYNVDVAAVAKEYEHIQDPQKLLNEKLEAFSAMVPKEKWKFSSFLVNLSRFFTPERPALSRNFIKPSIASLLVSKIEFFCNGDRKFAFLLYDKFPETMDYLLYFIEERPRIVTFRNDMSMLLKAAGISPSTYRDARRAQCIEALRNLNIRKDDFS